MPLCYLNSVFIYILAELPAFFPPDILYHIKQANRAAEPLDTFKVLPFFVWKFQLKVSVIQYHINNSSL